MKISTHETDYFINSVFDRIIYPKIKDLPLRVKFTPHFKDRIADRLILNDLKSMSELLNSFLDNYVCQLIYLFYLEDRPSRLEIEYKNIVLGFSVSDIDKKTITFRTVMKNRNYRGNQRAFIFDLNNKKSEFSNSL